MTERLAVDTNAAIDFIRPNRPDPPLLRDAREIVLPLAVLGELFAGAQQSDRVVENLSKVEELVLRWHVLTPDVETARVYGRLRRFERATRASMSRLNDLWIAALCIQHGLSLLTSDHGFDVIPELEVLHW